MTHKVKIFENVFPDSATGHWTTFRDQIGRCELPKDALDYHAKKLGLRRTRPSPHFAQNGPIAPKIPRTLSRLGMSTYTEFGPDRLRFAGLIPKDWFFGPKSNYNIGFQPTINGLTPELLHFWLVSWKDAGL